MVELQDERIGVATVDARLAAQLLEDPDAILDPISVHPSDLAGDVNVAVV